MKKKALDVTPKSFLNTFSLIHLVLSGSVLIFGLMIFLQTQNQELSINYSGDPLFFIVPVIAISGILLGNYLYRKSIDGLASKTSLKDKLSGFQTASIIRYALLEGPAFLGIVAFMNGGNQYFLIISTILLVWLILQRPTRDKVETDLKLEGSLKYEFQQENTPLV